jgi:hypothetical protein
MLSAESVSGAWRPKTEHERQLVRSQLEKILSDGRFTTSKRYPLLLRYIVEQTLAENEDELKERTLGIEVFHRSPDYDTNLDPVVRLCAGEVRKRLAQYYQSPAHLGELRIELNPGSYIPVFVAPAPDAPALQVSPETSPAGLLSPASSEPSVKVIPYDITSQTKPSADRRGRGMAYWLTAVIASGAVMLLVWGFSTQHWKPFRKQRSVLEEIWSPLLNSGKPVLFCVGERDFSAPRDSPLAQLQRGADDDSFIQASADRNDFVPLSDVQVLSRFVSLIGAHGNAFKVQSSRTTVSSQLREGPVVLIGALNNEWTLNRTSSLRFHLAGPDGPDQVYWIADAQHPESRAWQVRAKGPQTQAVKDFAIAARFTDESTGQIVLVAAGIAGSGTRAAGELLTDETSLKPLIEGSGIDWSKTNFEVVLSSQVVNGMQGKPKIEAEAYW